MIVKLQASQKFVSNSTGHGQAEHTDNITDNGAVR